MLQIVKVYISSITVHIYTFPTSNEVVITESFDGSTWEPTLVLHFHLCLTDRFKLVLHLAFHVTLKAPSNESAIAESFDGLSVKRFSNCRFI